MHWKAKAWEVAHGVDTSFIGSYKAKRPTKDAPPPENRPCDWCGEIVIRGSIHDECIPKEKAYWMDILD